MVSVGCGAASPLHAIVFENRGFHPRGVARRVESLIEHPGAMTRTSTAGSQLEVPDDLVGLSVGIEGPADLIGDLEQAGADLIRSA